MFIIQVFLGQGWYIISGLESMLNYISGMKFRKFTFSTYGLI